MINFEADTTNIIEISFPITFKDVIFSNVVDNDTNVQATGTPGVSWSTNTSVKVSNVYSGATVLIIGRV